ncbi:hypothetical protein CWR48_02225 [Oceanobacillus arenosus]|uniref:Uncharacterized protein n=1 Tax=Oceanobacillus arenosus TaxID=1229153 RepID=A0A3D8Q3Q0_9BACI|nr:hypothetical protein CWR48_02225 [Oceanobacillus arenosus]
MFHLAENVEKDQKLNKEALNRLMELKDMFSKKYEEMLKREREIMEIKAVLERANSKIEYLNLRNRK